jgi:poly-gamma-glutamate synthesis protein (capsule biosynthesis protein)
MSKLWLACVGDIMCGDQFNQVGWGAASQIDRYGYDFVDPHIVSILKSHDLTLCNVECVLSDLGRDEHKVRTLHMRGRPGSAKLLSQWGIRVANLANNHILEHGPAAAEDTAKNLRQNGVYVTGIGDDGTFGSSPGWTEIPVEGQTVSILGVCLRDEKYAYCYRDDIGLLCKQIRQRVEGNHVVIVSVHWGDELIDRPSLDQRDVAEKLMEAGSTAVIGHHPHVVQGSNRGNGQLVVFSLGNFIFDSWCQSTGWSMILSIGIENRRVVQHEIIPILRTGDFRPCVATGRRKEEILSEIDRRNHLVRDYPADPQSYRKRYDADLKRVNRSDRLKLWLRVGTLFWKTPLRHWWGVLSRPFQRRLGTW